MTGHCCGCTKSQIAGKTANSVISSFFGNSLGNLAELLTSTITCKRNLNLFKALTTIVLSKTYFWHIPQFSDRTEISYKPFALKIEQLSKDINIHSNSTKVKGTSGNDLIISHPEGSEVFAIGGLNYLVAGNGPDKFYFSKCSTDIIENKVSVIDGFNKSQDSIVFFCTKALQYPENITILHEEVNNTEITYIHVVGLEKNSSIALIGNIELNSSEIILNEKWPYF